MSVIKIQTGLRLDEETYNKLKVLSDRDNRSLNNLSELIIRRYIAEYEERNGVIVFDPDQTR